MEKVIKTGSVDVPDENFDDENVMALISIRLPLVMVKELKRLSLTEEFSGKYQSLIKSILSNYINSNETGRRNVFYSRVASTKKGKSVSISSRSKMKDYIKSTQKQSPTRMKKSER